MIHGSSERAQAEANFLRAARMWADATKQWLKLDSIGSREAMQKTQREALKARRAEIEAAAKVLGII